ncbi:hypothetical protein BDA99DRAFT_569289, partial [Phascolomyces articulosus]
MASSSSIQTQTSSYYQYERIIIPILPMKPHQRDVTRLCHEDNRILKLSLFSSLSVTCIFQINYPHYLYPNDYFSSEKLDYFVNKMNGLICVEPMTWIEQPLQSIMSQNCGLRLEQPTLSMSTQSYNPSYCFRPLLNTVSSINTPLSVALERPAPHGNLIKIYLRMEWQTKKPSSLTNALEELTEDMKE